MKREIKILENVDIKPHLNFGIGGRVKYLCEVSTEKEVMSALKIAKRSKIPHFILGGGCNLVFSDKLHDLFVIKLKGGKISINKSKMTIMCDAGVKLFSLVEESVKNGFSGIENLIGIPGTVGGAIYGNAGAYGNSIGAVVESVKIFDGKEVRNIKAKDCKFHYRGSIFKKKKWVILGAKFKFKKGKADELTAKMKEILDIRNKKFPMDMKCPGSYFKNILIDELDEMSKRFLEKEENKKLADKIIGGKLPAGCLLEEIGAKGMRVGDVAVSDFHANIMINLGNGTFDDLMELADKLKEKGFKFFLARFKEEVVIVA